MHTMKKVMLAGLALLIVVGAAGCNTVRGIGKDIKKGGEAIEKAAQ